MKCERCGASNANTHVKTIINGELREYDLCAECAHKLGYTNVFSDMESDFSHLLGSFFGNVLPARTQTARCEFCGSTYAEIADTGHVHIAMRCSLTGLTRPFSGFTATRRTAASTARQLAKRRLQSPRS